MTDIKTKATRLIAALRYLEATFPESNLSQHSAEAYLQALGDFDTDKAVEAINKTAIDPAMAGKTFPSVADIVAHIEK